MAQKGACILRPYRTAEMKLLQKAISIYPQQAGKALAVEAEYAVFIFDHPILYSYFYFNVTLPTTKVVME